MRACRLWPPLTPAEGALRLNLTSSCHSNDWDAAAWPVSTSTRLASAPDWLACPQDWAPSVDESTSSCLWELGLKQRVLCSPAAACPTRQAAPGDHVPAQVVQQARDQRGAPDLHAADLWRGAHLSSLSASAGLTGMVACIKQPAFGQCCHVCGVRSILKLTLDQ